MLFARSPRVEEILLGLEQLLLPGTRWQSTAGEAACAEAGSAAADRERRE
jgi:hypothetical protein